MKDKENKEKIVIKDDAQNFKPTEPKEIDKKTKKALTNPNSIHVVALDADSSSFRVLDDFIALRWVDPDTKAVYIKHDEKKFLIPFPEIEEKTNNLSIPSMTNRMLQLEEEIKQEYEEDNPDINEKDLIDEYMMIKGKLRESLYNSSSAFFGYKKGVPMLFVMRKGSEWFPLKVDSDTSTLRTISNARNTITRNLESNKRLKYGALSSLTTIGIIFLVATFLMCGLGVYSWYKAFTLQNEIMSTSPYVQLVESCTTGFTTRTKDMEQSIIKGISDNIIADTTKNDPVGVGGGGTK